jgi:hypothetical protein
LAVPLTRDHLSAMSGITADGRLFMQTQDHAYRSNRVVALMRRSCSHTFRWAVS